MSARVSIDYSAPHDVRIHLRQSSAEVTRFFLFVFVILAAWYLLMPRAREAPGFLFALLAVAGGWSVIALMGREEYVVDAASGTVSALIESPLGTRRDQLGAGEIVAVRLALGGPEDNRRLVELVAEDGKVRLRLPRRITTLSTADQSEIGQVLANTLGVPLRGVAMSGT